ncbi:uncharacterized protein LOC130966870 [Arachis stenosperma]|uniref:uncharacterized protein LOC130966870 n=1 Tax=Arachis stenosperma TaxID=217475 RepID=UPI0025AB6B68|nr:uncharacterized protein LOC130966870 [Arachis stenosperma]
MDPNNVVNANVANPNGNEQQRRVLESYSAPTADLNSVNSEAPQKKGVMEVEALNAIIAQNKLMSQQMSLLTQHMGGMQVSAINTQNPPQEISYDMIGNFVQNDHYDYAQSSSEQAPEYKPKMPYPQRLQKASKEKQFSKFLDVFKKLHINIPFAEALEKMPLYAKFMKELLTYKRNWKEQEIVVLTKECSAIIQHNLYEKMPDPGSFVIPCTIGDVTIQRALCDLGASINLMPLSVMKKLQIGEHPNDSKGCMKINVIEPLVQEVLKAEVLDDILDPISEYKLVEVDDSPPHKAMVHTPKAEEEAPKLELKLLPPSLKYEFLGENDSYR